MSQVVEKPEKAQVLAEKKLCGSVKEFGLITRGCSTACSRSKEKQKLKMRRITSKAVETTEPTFLLSLSRGDLIWPRSHRPADRRLEVRAGAPDGLLLIGGGDVAIQLQLLSIDFVQVQCWREPEREGLPGYLLKYPEVCFCFIYLFFSPSLHCDSDLLESGDISRSTRAQQAPSRHTVSAAAAAAAFF